MRLQLVIILVVIFVYLGQSTAQSDRSLVKISWQKWEDLLDLENYDLDVRYAIKGFVLASVTGHELEILQRDKREVYILCEVDEQNELYAIQTERVEEIDLSDKTSFVLVVDRSTGIIKGRKDEMPVRDKSRGMVVVLPHRMSLRGLIPSTITGKKTVLGPKNQFISSLLDSVSITRMEYDLGHLVYLNPSYPYNNSLSNLRSRYARRPEAKDSAATYIMNRLMDALPPGSSVKLIPFRNTPDDTIMYNVEGILKGTDPEAGYYLISGHYDSIALHSFPGRDWDWRSDPAPGADDNATGVILLLESARLLSRFHFPWSIKFVAFSGEELGLFGSKNYAEEAKKSGEKILGVINCDMLGYNFRYDKLDVVGNPASEWLVSLLKETNSTYNINLLLGDKIDERIVYSDHSSFWSYGYDGVFVSESFNPFVIDSSGYYIKNRQFHTVGDIADSVNVRLVAKGTKLVVAALAQFALQDSLPDLAIQSGDIKLSKDGQKLFVTVRNLKNFYVKDKFTVKISSCSLDSTDCEFLTSGEISSDIPGGGNATLEFPWGKLGQIELLVEIDPEGRIKETTKDNNRAYQDVRLEGKTVSLSQVYVWPNPLRNSQLHFHYLLSRAANVNLEVFNMAGEKVWEYESFSDVRSQPPGSRLGINDVVWNCRNLGGAQVSTGLYIYRISAFDPQTETSDSTTGKFAIVR